MIPVPSNTKIWLATALASDVGMHFKELDKQVKAQIERVAQKLNDIASGYPTFAQSERGWATIKDCRINSFRFAQSKNRQVKQA